MGRLDDLASKSGRTAMTGQPTAPVPEEEAAADVVAQPHPARVALSHITIGDLIIFLFKLAIASIVVAIPFGIVALILSSIK